MNNIKRSLCFALCATISIYSSNVSASTNNDKTSIHQQKVKGGGTIVMTDVIMAVTLNDLEDRVIKVVVLDAENDATFQKNGCGDNQCFFNLSTVASGSYTAVVYTEKGDSFSATIQR